MDVATRVKDCTEFSKDNDLYGERDFGAFDVAGVGCVFWKIDYYDRTLDGADHSKTIRVLTIILASEY